MCAGPDCYLMTYSFSAPQAEYFDSADTPFVQPQAMPPEKYYTGQPNPSYNDQPFPALRDGFDAAAQADFRTKYPNSSSGCNDGCICSELDDPPPDSIKTTTFRVPFETTVEATAHPSLPAIRWKVSGTYQVQAKRTPGICVPGKFGKTSRNVSWMELRDPLALAIQHAYRKQAQTQQVCYQEQ